MPSESKTESANETSNVKSIKESLVCLTQEQLQQILNSVKASGQNARDDSTAHVQNGEKAGDLFVYCSDCCFV